MEIFVLILIFAVVFLILIPLGIFIRSYVLTKLWAWFIVPIFHLPTLGLAQAFGVMVVVSFLTYHGEFDMETLKEKKWWQSLITFCSPLITLGFAYIFKCLFL